MQSRVTQGENLTASSVRFWAMVSIIAIHAHSVAGSLVFGRNWQPGLGVHLLIQPFRFSTIAFFLISGFLLSNRLPKTDSLGYFLRRCKALGMSWSLWFLMLLIAFSLADLAKHTVTRAEIYKPAYLIRQAWGTMNGTSYWFIPCLLVSIALLLVLQPWLERAWVGLGFLAVFLFFAVNLYFRWLPTEHTKTLIGFTFFIWLGIWWGRNPERVDRLIKRLGLGGAIAFLLLTLVASCVEGYFIELRGTADPLNNLRISNALYAVAVIIALSHVKVRTWPSFVNVGSQTFGVVLVHMPLLFALSQVARRVVHPHHTLLAMVILWAELSIICPLLAFAFVRVIVQSEQFWWIAATRAPKRPVSTAPALAPENFLPDNLVAAPK